MASITANTYEGDNPDSVVEHVFFGETLDDAEAVLQAHLKTDAFLSASMQVETETDIWEGEWEGIPLSTEIEREP